MKTFVYKNRCVQDRIFDFLVYFSQWSALIIVGYPLIYVISCSFSDPMAIITGQVWLFPVKPTIKAYAAILQDERLIRSFNNSIILVAVGTIMTVTVTVIAAYPLYRREFVGKRLVMILFTITMFFSGGMIPSYVVVNSLGMLDTIWALTLPGALGVWGVIVMRTFFRQNIPEELREATSLDGGSDFSFLFWVVVPLSKAIIAVMALFYAVGRWNAYFDAMIYLSDSRKYPLPLILRDILIMNQVDLTKILQGGEIRDIQRRQSTAELLKYALIVASSLPVMLLYPFVQKYFVKGVVLGSLKG